VNPHAAVADRVDELIDEDAAGDLRLVTAVVVKLVRGVRDTPAIVEDEVGMVDRAAATEARLRADIPEPLSPLGAC
jgi:hypothetical protein